MNAKFVRRPFQTFLSNTPGRIYDSIAADIEQEFTDVCQHYFLIKTRENIDIHDCTVVLSFIHL